MYKYCGMTHIFIVCSLVSSINGMYTYYTNALVFLLNIKIDNFLKRLFHYTMMKTVSSLLITLFSSDILSIQASISA